MTKKKSAQAERQKSRALPWMGRLSASSRFKMLGAVMLAAIVGAAACGASYVEGERRAAAQARGAAQMLTDSQRIAKNATMAGRGEPGSFAALEQYAKRFDSTLGSLRAGGRIGSVELPAASGQARPAVAAVAASWDKAGVIVLRLLAAKGSVESLQAALARLGELDAPFMASAQSIATSLGALPAAPAAQKAMARDLPMLTQRMAKNANALAGPGGGAQGSGAAAALAKDVAAYKALIDALGSGSASEGLAPIQDGAMGAKLAENRAVFNEYARHVQEVARSQAAALGAKEALGGSEALLDALDSACEALLAAYEAEAGDNGLALMMGVAFFMVFVGAAAVGAKIFSEEGSSSERAAEGERQTRAQQEAILTLLSELGELADGDLTTRATASDTFTGAIADAFNVTVDELRRVIKNVIYAANRVGEGAEEAAKISTSLAASASEQSGRLALTGESMAAMSDSMGRIAQETAEAAKASRESQKASREGLVVVGQAIERMDAIRGTIQDTSKKIKLVGESSTAIGEVSGLISDITKQINILALNAAIQAASAGEAGRGFAVVAKDVQRLALSSAEAAKRIDDLVLTIQEDAKGAVSAMESSTHEVVLGAGLTDQAGDSLKQIEASVSGLADEIEAVTIKVRRESEAARALSKEMLALQAGTSATAEQSRHGAEAIEQVRSVAEELRESVGNFTV